MSSDLSGRELCLTFIRYEAPRKEDLRAFSILYFRLALAVSKEDLFNRARDLSREFTGAVDITTVELTDQSDLVRV